MPAPDPFPVIHLGAEEEYRSAGYSYDNARRDRPQMLVIQRTVAGAGFFRDVGGRRLVPAGQAMLFTHREPTAYGYPPEATEPYRLRFISFSPAGTADLFARLRSDFGSVVNMPDASEATALHDEIIQRYRRRQFLDRWHESELIFRLLLTLYREQVRGTQGSDPIEFGLHYLRNHFRSPLNLKAIVQKCGVSREHFIREFGARHGESPGALLRRLRLEHARDLLGATRLSVQEVALASGFTSSNTFCRAYRTRFGHSPGETR